MNFILDLGLTAGGMSDYHHYMDMLTKERLVLFIIYRSITTNTGFQFSHWQSLKTIKTKNTNISIQYNFEQDDEIVAYLEEKGQS